MRLKQAAKAVRAHGRRRKSGESARHGSAAQGARQTQATSTRDSGKSAAVTAEAPQRRRSRRRRTHRGSHRPRSGSSSRGSSGQRQHRREERALQQEQQAGPGSTAARASSQQRGEKKGEQLRAAHQQPVTPPQGNKGRKAGPDQVLARPQPQQPQQQEQRQGSGRGSGGQGQQQEQAGEPERPTLPKGLQKTTGAQQQLQPQQVRRRSIWLRRGTLHSDRLWPFKGWGTFSSRQSEAPRQQQQGQPHQQQEQRQGRGRRQRHPSRHNPAYQREAKEAPEEKQPQQQQHQPAEQLQEEAKEAEEDLRFREEERKSDRLRTDWQARSREMRRQAQKYISGAEFREKEPPT